VKSAKGFQAKTAPNKLAFELLQALLDGDKEKVEQIAKIISHDGKIAAEKQFPLKDVI
jgi:uridine phosphorylase